MKHCKIFLSLMLALIIFSMPSAAFADEQSFWSRVSFADEDISGYYISGIQQLDRYSEGLLTVFCDKEPFYYSSKQRVWLKDSASGSTLEVYDTQRQDEELTLNIGDAEYTFEVCWGGDLHWSNDGSDIEIIDAGVKMLKSTDSSIPLEKQAENIRLLLRQVHNTVHNLPFYLEFDNSKNDFSFKLYVLGKDAGYGCLKESEDKTLHLDVTLTADITIGDYDTFGDLNCDGRISMEDVVFLQKSLAGFDGYELSAKMKHIADVSAKEGWRSDVTMEAVVLIQARVAQIIYYFPADAGDWMIGDPFFHPDLY